MISHYMNKDTGKYIFRLLNIESIICKLSYNGLDFVLKV